MTASIRPNLGLQSGWSLDEDGWDIGMEADLRQLDTVVMGSIKDKDLTTPPGSPTDGDRYLVPAGATGAWTGKANNLTVWQGQSIGWTFFQPKIGWRVYVEDEKSFYTYTSVNLDGWRDWETVARQASLVWDRSYTAPILNPGVLDPPQVSGGASIDQDPTGPRIVHNLSAADQAAEQLERLTQDPMSYAYPNSPQGRDAYWALPSYYQAVGITLGGISFGTTNCFIGIGCGQHLRAAGGTVNEEHIGLRYSAAADQWQFCVNSKTGAVGHREFIISLGSPSALGVNAPTALNVGKSTVYEMLYYPNVGVEVALNHGKFRRMITNADMGGDTPFTGIFNNANQLNSILGGFGWYVFTGTGASGTIEYAFYAPRAMTFFIPQG